MHRFSSPLVSVLVVLTACSGKEDTGSENFPPTGLQTKVLPMFPVQQVDDLRCTVDVPPTDPNDDPITYAFTWTVDGQPFTDTDNSAHYVGDLVPATATTALQEWACTITPSDPYQAGAPHSHAVTVTSGYEAWEDLDVGLDQADYIITADAGSDIGSSVISAGDVDGDEHDDILIADAGAFGSGNTAAAVYLIHGATFDDPELLVSSDTVFAGEATDAVGFTTAVGASAIGAGDVDGDGRSDPIIGVPEATVGAGRTVGFSGAGVASIQGIADADWTVAGADTIGSSVGVGDVDGDGRADVLTAEQRDRLWLVLGDGIGASIDVADADATIALGDVEVGAIVVGDDVDGDGIADVVIASAEAGAWVANGDQLLAGLSGACTLTGDPGVGFGSSTTVVPDIDGDGLAEVAVSATEATGESGAGDGVVSLWHSGTLAGCGALTTADADLTFVGHDAGAAGTGLVGVDFDADAIGDLFVSAPGVDGGVVSLLLGINLRDGEVELDSNVDHHLWAEGPSHAAGTALAETGDIDKDGRTDLAIGAPGNGPGGTVYLVRSPP